jgi:hypothetical protein
MPGRSSAPPAPRRAVIRAAVVLAAVLLLG